MLTAATRHDLTGRGGLSNLCDGANSIALGLQIQDEHIRLIIKEKSIKCVILVRGNHYLDSRDALENLLQAQPHETLTAKNSDRDGRHCGA